MADDVTNAVRVLRFAFPMSLRDDGAVGHAQNLALAVDLVTRALEEVEEGRETLARKGTKLMVSSDALIAALTKERDEARAELAACHREDERDSKARAADIFLFETRIERLTKVLRNVLWVARGATDSPLEDAFGHALSNIEMRVEEALGIGPEDEVEHD